MNSERSLVRRTAPVAASAVAALVLAACGGNGDSSAEHDGHSKESPSASASASSQGQQNAADVAFAKGMIPHHRQAVEMADLAPSRAGSAEVKALAEQIKKAQDPEIKTLSGWLTSWGEEVPAEGTMDHSEHGASGMSGMMTAEEMDKLKDSSGKAFDTAFMEMMIKHHESAVSMAETEKADGFYEPATKMADAIISSQTAEITHMSELLGKN
ncbi:DUF305 domain-containing protein [Streptomyces sp. AVP053U2]|uniref:DUF305 domain-containing protein n=1 Tax=Streptomyces sp. AVP053U2 TaxID=1737066 RepID=UPI00073BFC57|nr:DUF305 domain-containing protein [Streptomyces sp. AVP053U2]ODA71580.1 hypothetical protein APS67_004133 [Streptomyces sp. AVP053U2]